MAFAKAKACAQTRRSKPVCSSSSAGSSVVLRNRVPEPRRRERSNRRAASQPNEELKRRLGRARWRLLEDLDQTAPQALPGQALCVSPIGTCAASASTIASLSGRTLRPWQRAEKAAASARSSRPVDPTPRRTFIGVSNRKRNVREKPRPYLPCQLH